MEVCIVSVDLFLRSHVELSLAEVLGVCRVQADPDGDYRFRRGTAGCFVRIVPGEEPSVDVVALAVTGISRSSSLLKEINDVNARSRVARVFWAGQCLWVVSSLPAAGCSVDSLRFALEACATVANDIGELTAAVHGGQTMFQSGEATAALDGVGE